MGSLENAASGVCGGALHIPNMEGKRAHTRTQELSAWGRGRKIVGRRETRRRGSSSQQDQQVSWLALSSVISVEEPEADLTLTNEVVTQHLNGDDPNSHTP